MIKDIILKSLLFAIVIKAASVAIMAAEPSPKVLCIVLGVSNNQGWELPAAKQAAVKFKDVVVSLFPGAGTEVRLLLDEDATLEAISKVLYREIPKLPRYSAVIFYFAGHGLYDATNTNYDEDVK